MRVGIDFDGVITEGTYITQPVDLEAYWTLKPHDRWTKNCWNKLCRHHEVFVITSRSFQDAHRMCASWLTKHEMGQPLGLITSIEQKDKAKLLYHLKCDLHIDDSPLVYRADRKTCFLMDNPGWQENQEVITSKRLYTWQDIYKLIWKDQVAAINN